LPYSAVFDQPRDGLLIFACEARRSRTLIKHGFRVALKK
jgi:hypothetical protein